MKAKLDCVMLVDDDNMSNFLNKIIVDDSKITDHVVRQHSAYSALNYLSDSVITKRLLPFPDVIFLNANLLYKPGCDFIAEFETAKQSFPFIPLIIILASPGSEPNHISTKNTNIAHLYSLPFSAILLDLVIAKFFFVKSINNSKLVRQVA